MLKKTLKKQALELSDKERAQLAHFLIDSLKPEPDYDSEEAWSEELKDRINKYQEGKSSTTPWDQVKKNALN